jgi:hypothetical protein
MNTEVSTIKVRLLEIIELLLSDEELLLKWDTIKNDLKRQTATIKELEKIMPEAWVPLRIACSVFLTQRTNLRTTRCPDSLADWKDAWDEILIMLSKKDIFASEFTLWLKRRGNHRFAGQFGKYYKSYWESRNWSVENSLKDLYELRSLKTAEEIQKWWMKFDGIGREYAKNIPMDEMDYRFVDFVKLDFRLSKLIDLLGGSTINSEGRQDLFKNVAYELNMTQWELDRFCFNFYKEILFRIKKS